MTVEIRALRPDDDRNAFRSGDAALDLFFHRYSGQNQFRHHLGVTYIAVENGRIVGFTTVSPATLDAEELPSGRRMPPYPLPVLRIARLAVEASAAGRGLGNALMRFAIELAEMMRNEVGCIGLLVDAKVGVEGYYERLGFLALAAIEGVSRIVPAPRPLFLPLSSVPRRRE